MQQSRRGSVRIEGNFTGKGLLSWWTIDWIGLSTQYVIEAKTCRAALECSLQMENDIIPFILHLIRCTKSYAQLWDPQYEKDIDRLESLVGGGLTRQLAGLRGWSLCSLKGEGWGGFFKAIFNYLMGDHREHRARFFFKVYRERTRVNSWKSQQGKFQFVERGGWWEIITERVIRW